MRAKICEKIAIAGGGVLRKSTWFFRGVSQKTMSVHNGGRGGQKWAKIRPHGLWMPPYLVLKRPVE